ncbi:MAG: hypothetical protein ACE5Z5_07910 [Candidatus Bathyarchaeia archaeon]
MSVEFLVKLRDAAQMIVDACEDYLTTIAPAEARGLGDFDMLAWTKKSGPKGDYEQTTKKANKDKAKEFEALQNVLDEHKGFWQSPNYRFWFHMAARDVIDRRRRSSNPHQRMQQNIENVRKAADRMGIA